LVQRVLGCGVCVGRDGRLQGGARAGFFPSRIDRHKKKSADPGRSRSPDQGARKNSTKASAPFTRGAAQGAASFVQEPCGSGWSFCGKQFLDAHASFKLCSSPLGAACCFDSVGLIRLAAGGRNQPAAPQFSRSTGGNQEFACRVLFCHDNHPKSAPSAINPAEIGGSLLWSGLSQPSVEGPLLRMKKGLERVNKSF
jgi:hypothetical protein